MGRWDNSKLISKNEFVVSQKILLLLIGGSFPAGMFAMPHLPSWLFFIKIL